MMGRIELPPDAEIKPSTSATDADNIDSLFAWADDRYKAREFDIVDAVLAALDVTSVSSSVLHGFVVISWWPKQVEGIELPSRQAFLERVAAHWSTANPELLASVRGPGSSPGFFTA